MLKRLKFVTVPVQDQSRALEFYTTKLGLKVFTDQTMGNDRWIELQVPGGETMVVLVRQPDFQPGKMPAAVFVATTSSPPTRLKARGVQFTSPRRGSLGRARDLKDGKATGLFERPNSRIPLPAGEGYG
jgi:catechol 2,3-dioxygenase-like lactoylglutathione lyase family enzyme